MSIGQTFAAAVQYHRAGRLGEAEGLYRKVLQADPNHADTLHMLGVIAHQTSRQQVAIEMISRAIAQNGRVPAFHYNLGNALRAHGNLEEAVSAYRQALTLRPNHAETYLNLSNALQAQGKLEEAAEACQRAVSSKPDMALAHNNLGNILLAQNRFEAALDAYSRALRLKPDLAEAHYNLGLALLSAGRPAEAVASCQRALVYKPEYVAACVTLGHALMQGGDSAGAVRSYQRAIALDPNCCEAMLGCAVATIPIICSSTAESAGTTGSFGKQLDALVQWVAANPGKLGEAVGRIQPFYLAYRPAEVTHELCRYGDLASAEAAAYWGPQQTARAAARDRIRIAVVSGQVRRHPVWEINLRGLIAHLNTRDFEVFLYHTGTVVDEETDWARGHVARFVQGPKPLRSWLTEITQAQADVILYPEVGMDPTTCTLAALRLAPLQIAGWGHPVTTGLPTIDWYLSAELLESAQAEQHYREKLIRLPGTGVYTEFAAHRKEPWGGPERGQGVVRFALCQQPLKFDPADDLLLARIAKAAGAAEFWLATPGNMPWTAVKLRERIGAAFRAEGLDPDAYLRATPWLPRSQFLSFLDDMDICLDCPAFSGYTTAWQAIHSGLPIITLEGPYMRQRLAAGLMRQVGSTEGITLSREQYVAAAGEWANECRDTHRWAERRAALRRAAPQADGNRSAILAFEQKLREAVQSLSTCSDAQ